MWQFYFKKRFGNLSNSIKKEIVLGLFYMDIWFRSLITWIQKCNIQIKEKNLNILNLNLNISYIKIYYKFNIDEILINWDEEIFYYIINFYIPNQDYKIWKILPLPLGGNGMLENLQEILEFDLARITEILMPVRIKYLHYENDLLEFYVNHFNMHLDFFSYYVDLINFQIVQRKILKFGWETALENLIDANFLDEKKEIYIRDLREAIKLYDLKNYHFSMKNDNFDMKKFENELNNVFHLFLSEIKRLKILNVNVKKENK
jgi:hypothetical protein